MQGWSQASPPPSHIAWDRFTQLLREAAQFGHAGDSGEAGLRVRQARDMIKQLSDQLADPLEDLLASFKNLVLELKSMAPTTVELSHV